MKNSSGALETRAWESYWLALTTPDCDIEKYQEIACKESRWAYLFAKDIPGANISYCQKNACKDKNLAYDFSKFIPEANIEYCYRLTNSKGKKDIEFFILNDL